MKIMILVPKLVREICCKFLGKIVLKNDAANLLVKQNRRSRRRIWTPRIPRVLGRDPLQRDNRLSGSIDQDRDQGKHRGNEKEAQHPGPAVHTWHQLVKELTPVTVQLLTIRRQSYAKFYLFRTPQISINLVCSRNRSFYKRPYTPELCFECY